jgi:hypothetical protein
MGFLIIDNANREKIKAAIARAPPTRLEDVGALGLPGRPLDHEPAARRAPARSVKKPGEPVGYVAAFSFKEQPGGMRRPCRCRRRGQQAAASCGARAYRREFGFEHFPGKRLRGMPREGSRNSGTPPRYQHP